jgi:hypothetical protein
MGYFASQELKEFASDKLIGPTTKSNTDWLILMVWDYVSELLPLTDILLIPQIMYE